MLEFTGSMRFRLIFGRFLSSLCILALLPSCAGAMTLASVKLKEHIKSPGTEDWLVLNGAGIRSKFFMEIYIGALYLMDPARSAEAALDEKGPKSLRLHVLLDSLSREKIVDSWGEGFRRNLSPVEIQDLCGRIERFSSMARDMKRGDEVHFDYIPGHGTDVVIDDELMGTIEGADFFRALLKVWLGPRPKDEGLKRAMLGGTEDTHRPL